MDEKKRVTRPEKQFVPDKAPKRWLEAARNAERERVKSKHSKILVENQLSLEERKIAELRAQDPGINVNQVAKALGIGWVRARDLFYSDKVIQLLAKMAEPEDKLVERLRKKSIDTLDKALDGKANRIQLEAAKHISKQIFDAPAHIEVNVPVLTPDDLQDLARRVIDITPEDVQE